MKKVMLAILDGVGIRDELKGNAFKQANKPCFDYLINKYPHTELEASGTFVGLPDGQMGNSETGHLNIGAGRIVYQPLELINKSIRDGEFFNKKEFIDVINYTKENNKKLHIIGLISDGGIHSHINHLKALLTLCKNYNVSPSMHLITDGRDTKVDSGYSYVKEIIDMNIGRLSTLCGRYYTMDRDKNFDRLERGYNLITRGIGDVYKNAKDVFLSNYKNNVYDEFIEPSLIEGASLIEQGDGIIWFNYRPDRAIQILTYLEKITNHIVTMMPVSDNIKAPYAYKIDKLNNTMGEYLSKNNYTQLRIAETEKYAHVTYFFDGGIDVELPGCDRVLIPSPKVATYDLKPEMSAYLITDKLMDLIGKYDVIILNYANCDMVGHTGNMDATIKAVEAVDTSLRRVYDKCVEQGVTLFVSADHGNCELMIDNDNNIVTTHTTNKVPFIVCSDNLKLKEGKISNIIPTMFDYAGIDKPVEMTENSLIEK